MLKSPPSSSGGDDYQESNGRVAEQKQLQLKAIHRPRFKSPSQLMPITNSTPPCNLLTRPWAGLGPICAEAVSSVSRRQRHMAQGGGGGSSNGRPYSTLSQNGTHQQSARGGGTGAHGRVAKRKQLKLKAIQRP
ncbi:unnamed protein product, partial [Staurois parvus]